MNFSYKLGLIFSATLMALPAIAVAADIPTGSYLGDSIVTASTCGNLTSSLKQGNNTISAVIYPGAGKKMTLASPQTSSTGKAGSASSDVCVAEAATPSKGLNGANLTFDCYSDTTSGPAYSAQAKLVSTFKVGASHSPSIKQVTVTSNVVVGLITVCSFTTDGTYALE